MSATNRGSTYRPLAAYYTALEDARFLLGLLPIWDRPRRVLDPHVGSGNWLRAVTDLEAERRVYHRLLAIDLNPAAEGLEFARQEGGWRGVGDFLEVGPPCIPDVVIGNPPYSIPQPAETCSRCAGVGSIQGRKKGDSLFCPKCKGEGRTTPRPVAVAHEHIERALSLVEPGGHVAFLLRLGIIEGKDRLPLWRSTPLRKVFALSSRPSFCGGGTDQTSYGFFWWQRGWTGPAEFEVVAPPVIATTETTG